MTDRLELARTTFAAFNRRDVETYVRAFAPDAEWWPLRSSTEGPYRGHDGLRAWFDDTAEMFEHLHAEVEEVQRNAGSNRRVSALLGGPTSEGFGGPWATKSFSRRVGRARGRVRPRGYGPAMRLIVARCEVVYTGRLNARLPEALRLLMIKSDGSVMVHADHGGYKPSNWMTPPAVIEEEGEPLERIVVRKRAGASEDRLEIRVEEILSDVEHDMGEAAALEKDGVEADLQEALADSPEWCGEGFRLVRREWPTDIGPVDLMCRRDEDDGWVAVEIKRVGTIDAVEQLSRYLERIRRDPALADCHGVLAAQAIKPQARTLAETRGIDCVEVDLDVVRGDREPDLTLFG